MWEKGKIEIDGTEYNYSAKVYDEPSQFGINEGRISKLTVKQGKKDIINYDRGWDIEPTDMITHLILDIILKKFS